MSSCRPGPVDGGGSKLGELIGRLHDYLATSTEEKNGPALPGHWNGWYNMEENNSSRIGTITKNVLIYGSVIVTFLYFYLFDRNHGQRILG